VLVEPSRTRLSPRARTPPVLSTPPSPRRVRVRVRPRDGEAPPVAEPIDEPAPEPGPEPEPPIEPPPPNVDGRFTVPMPGAVLLVAALAMAISSRGDVVVLALLLGFGAMRRASGVAIALALTASLVRWGSPSLGAIAGAQAVLGPAGWTGSAAAVASAWLAAVALLLAAVPLSRANNLVLALWLAPFAIAAADVSVGPAPGGALPLRVVASVVAMAAAVALARWRSLPTIAIGCGALALLCAGIAR